MEKYLLKSEIETIGLTPDMFYYNAPGKNIDIDAMFSGIAEIEDRFVVHSNKQQHYMYKVVSFDNYKMIPRAKYNETKIYFLPDNHLSSTCSQNFNGEEPKKIGKPTAKKLSDWVSYLRAQDAFYTKQTAYNSAVIDAFLADIEPFNPEWNGSEYCEIIRDGIKCKIRLDRKSGSFSVQNEVYFQFSNGFDNFKKLIK
jgi:hypothetical protein